VVRTFGQANFQLSTLGNNTFNPNSLATNLGNNTNLLEPAGAGYVAVDQLFLQFAGFTFGKSVSAFASPWNGYPGNNNSFLIGGPDYVTGVNNIQYTAQFGNGVSGTIGLDEPTVYNRTVVGNISVGLPATGTGVPAQAYGGVHAPDIVGNIRVDQAWGLFQISAAAHEVSGSYNILNGSLNPLGGFFGVPAATAAAAGAVGIAAGAPINLSEISGHPDAKWGGAVMAALQIKNIPTGAGDDIKFDVSYAKGDTKQVISTAATSPNFAMFGGTSRAGTYQSVGFGVTTDAVYLPAINGGSGDLKLTEAFGLRGAFNHNWDPYWSSSLFGSWSAVRYSGSVGDLNSAKGQYCAIYAVGKTVSADFSCNPDFNVSQLPRIGVRAHRPKCPERDGLFGPSRVS
jgi:hypothetical protein